MAKHRPFREIVTDAGKDQELAEALNVKQHQPRDWRIRNSIPPEMWRPFIERGWSNMDELLSAAEARREKKPARDAA